MALQGDFATEQFVSQLSRCESSRVGLSLAEMGAGGLGSAPPSRAERGANWAD